MRKQRAIEMLGGTARSTATAIGVVAAAIRGWPDPLNAITRDRILAAFLRVHAAGAMGLTLAELHESKAAQKALEDALLESEDSLRAIGRRARELLHASRLDLEQLRLATQPAPRRKRAPTTTAA